MNDMNKDVKVNMCKISKIFYCGGYKECKYYILSGDFPDECFYLDIYNTEHKICNCEQAIAEVVIEAEKQRKRNPESDGILPLTDEEKHEFSNKFLKHTNFIYYFRLIGGRIRMQFLNGIYDDYCDNCMAIKWLDERFNLSGDKK